MRNLFIITIFGIYLVLSGCAKDTDVVEKTEIDKNAGYVEFKSDLFYFKYPSYLKMVSKPYPVVEGPRKEFANSYYQKDGKVFMFELSISKEFPAQLFFDDVTGSQWWMSFEQGTKEDFESIVDSMKVFPEFSSLIKINEKYLKNADSVFYFDKSFRSTDKYWDHGTGLFLLPSANPSTFICPDNLYKSFDAEFCKDGSSLYRYDELITTEADLETFEVIHENYAKDKDSIYVFIKRDEKNLGKGVTPGSIIKLEGLALEDAEVLDRAYLKSKNGIYYWGSKLDGADFSTFKVLNGGYSRDMNHVYRYGIVFDEIDVNTFEIIDEDYAKDKSTVFYTGTKIEEADSNSFESLGMLYSRDKNHFFYEGVQSANPDPKDFEFNREGYYVQHGYLWKDSKKLSDKRVMTLIGNSDSANVSAFEMANYELDGKIFIYFSYGYIGIDKPAIFSNKYIIIDKLTDKIEIKTLQEKDFENLQEKLISVAPDQKSIAYVTATECADLQTKNAEAPCWIGDWEKTTVWLYDFITHQKKKIREMSESETVLSEGMGFYVDTRYLYWDKNTSELIIKPFQRNFGY